MRIVQVCPKYHPALGGVEEVVRQYSERLVKRGYGVEVYTTDGPSFATLLRQGFGGLTASRGVIGGVRVHRSLRIPYPILKPLSPAPALPLKLALAKADIFHLHANKYFCADTGALVAKLRRKPFIFQPHAGTFGSRLVGQLHNKTVGRLALSADVVICVSEYEKRLIEKSGVKVKRFEVLPNGVDVVKYGQRSLDNSFDPNSSAPGSESRRSRSVPWDRSSVGGNPVILFVGRLAPHKGLDILVEAVPKVLKEIPGARFVIVGPDGGMRKSTEHRAQSRGVMENFVFTGRVLEEEKIDVYQNADVFCLPSRSEAFGIAIIEAMAAGVPVVATDTQAIPEIVKDGETGLLFPVDDVNALANRLVTILKDKKSAKKMAEKALKVVRENYDWDIIVGRLERIYKSIV